MSPTFQGLDRAVAPPAVTAKRMLDTINGRWWNVYIGGPESVKGGGWTPAVVREYAAHGIDRFMLTYVGRQSRGPLTRAQGHADAGDALRIAREFGYTGDFPLCLDVEIGTFNHAPVAAVEYTHAWCQAVRAAGARPGVYTGPGPLQAMAKAGVPAEFVWVASWVTTTADRRNPIDAKGMPTHLWNHPGQRAWQYGGIIGKQACDVLGLNVDLSVAELGCLAPPPGGHAHAAAHRKERAAALRRGDHGAAVERLTRRLSLVPARGTGRAYLAAPRRRFDEQTAAAVRAFQHDHGLPTTGVYGSRTARALIKAVRHAKDHPPAHPTSPSRRGHGAPAAGTSRLVALVHEFERRDAEADQAWQALEAYGRKRARLLAQEAEDEVGLADVAAILARIEQRLETLVTLERREVELIDEAVEAPVVAVLEEVGAEAAAAPDPAPPAAPGESAHHGNGTQPAEHPHHVPLADVPDAELDHRIDQADRHLDTLRRARIARYARVESTLARLSRAGSTAPGHGSTKHDGPPTKHTGPPRKHSRPPHDGPPHRGPAGHGAGPTSGAKTASESVETLQRRLNRFSERFLVQLAPIGVDGKRGPETNKRICTAKYYLGYGGAERASTRVQRPFIRRLVHPLSPRYSTPAMLARAARRRRAQRSRAQRLASAPIEGTPKHVIDTIVLRIAEECGIHRTPAANDAANAAHGPTINGNRSDHQGPPGVAWAADMSNGSSPTPQMDQLARSLAKRFDIAWPGSGLVSATHNGYRFQLIYRTMEGGNHFNHVHFGLRVA